MARTNLLDKIMAENIPCPGFPQIIVTRGWFYQWLKRLGWNPCERGFASLDYIAFATPKTDEPVTPDDERDYWLGQVEEAFAR